MVRLSIIVPFYNVEKYIEQCIRSLYSQDIPYEEYEVICVDDCSPDGSRAIVERLQKEFPTLLLLLPQNRCLGGARNIGLKSAKGHYIWYVDSDDYIEPNCLGRLLMAAEETHVDILHFDYYSLATSGQVCRKVEPYVECIRNGIDFVLDESHERWYSKCPVVWRRLHKREFLLENNLFFVEKMMYEDTDLSLYMFVITNRVRHIDMCPYIHRVNTESITHKRRTPQIMRFTILQQKRCLRAYEAAKNEQFRQLIAVYIRSQLTILRGEIKGLGCKDKLVYGYTMQKEQIIRLRQFCNWRTWLAIKYGITCFVP